MTSGSVDFDTWYDVYLKAYRDPSVLPSLSCPNCGSKSLNLVFQSFRRDDGRGIRVFWCGSCMFGLAPNRVILPDNAEVTLFDEFVVPDFVVIDRHPA
ncbi:hypothetical protein ACFQ1S_19560 [Kibdelosporangium lantanae]|uniref:Uncharacterized protein n=1 Tax=Kibdelosporangium lantanae TaxID=1497396 RepID=A0ABW3M9Z6_9PSEU